MTNKLDVQMDLPTDAELAKMFDAVPIFDQYGVLDQVVRAGGRPIVTRARKLAPRSSKTGTAKKRSKKQRQSADWDYPLWKTIKQVVRKYTTAGHTVVGPEWPKGNKAYFNVSPKGRVRKLWGKNPSVFSGKGLSTIAPPIRNWIVQAFDETKSEQLLAMKTKLTKLMDQIWKNAGK